MTSSRVPDTRPERPIAVCDSSRSTVRRIRRTVLNAAGGFEGVRRGTPALDRGGGGRPSGGALGSAEGVEHLALPAPAKHAMARPLSGDVDAQVAQLAKHGLGDEGP